MGKVFGFLFLIVVMGVVCLSYTKFVFGLEFARLRKKFGDAVNLDPGIPDFSFHVFSPYDVPVEEHHKY